MENILIVFVYIGKGLYCNYGEFNWSKFFME